MPASLHTLPAADAPERTSFAERVGKAEAAAATTLAAAQPLEETIGVGEYRAYGYLPAAVAERLELRWWMAGTTLPQGTDVKYRMIGRIDFLGDDQLYLVMLDRSIIQIEGRNLGQLRQKIRRETATFVQCCHPDRAAAVPADQCCITKIALL